MRNKKQAFGLIDMLLGLIILTAIFVFSMSSFTNVSTVNINGTNGGKSVRQHVDEKVNEIENLKLQNIQYQQKMLNEMQ